MIDLSNVPAFILSGPHFLGSKPVRRGDKDTKPPLRFSDGADFNCWDPQAGDLCTIAELQKVWDERGFKFVGRSVSNTPLLCADFDHCFQNDGSLKPWAVESEFLDRWRAFIYYVEKSVNGDGLHVWFDLRHAHLKSPDDKKWERKFGKTEKGETEKIELFARNYCTLSGNIFREGEWGETPLDEKSYTAMKAWFAGDSKPTSPAQETGAYGKRLEALLAGDIDAAGFTDKSVADQSLCSSLARKGLTREMVKQIWLKSGLRTDDKIDRTDYIQRTLDKAFEGIKTEEAHAPLVISTARQLLKNSYKKRESLMVTAGYHPVFHTSSIIQVHAFRGVGKTAFELGLCGALVSGEVFLQWKATRQFRVLYVEGELPGEEMQERVRTLVGESENFAVITPEDQPDSRIPSLMTDEGRRLIEEAIVTFTTEVLVLDSISTLANIATNDESEWLALCEWFRLLRNKYGVALFFLMHDGKTGLQRGHSKSEDLLDKSVQLFWENGYRGQDGLKFALTFDKARQPVKEAHSLSVELIEKDGKLEWISAVRDASGDSQRAMAFSMFDAGHSIAKVRETLKANQNTMAEWKKEWKQSRKAPLEIETQVVEDDAPKY